MAWTTNQRANAMTAVAGSFVATMLLCVVAGQWGVALACSFGMLLLALGLYEWHDELRLQNRNPGPGGRARPPTWERLGWEWLR